MNKLLVVVFDTETKAFEGLSALQDLHKAGDITLYSTAVVVKDSSGKVSVKKAADPGPVGTGLGLLTGSLIGLLGGPAGVVVGAAMGGMTGAIFDLADVGMASDFLAEVSAALSPGHAAVMAEVDEEWVTPVDVRLGKLGGQIFRRHRWEVIEDMMEREAEAMEADLKALRAEMAQANAENRAALQARIDQAKKNLEALQKRVQDKQAAIEHEMTAKVTALREQTKSASQARKAQLEKRVAEVKAENEARRAKLEQAAKLIREALAPPQHA